MAFVGAVAVAYQFVFEVCILLVLTIKLCQKSLVTAHPGIDSLSDGQDFQPKVLSPLFQPLFAPTGPPTNQITSPAHLCSAEQNILLNLSARAVELQN